MRRMMKQKKFVYDPLLKSEINYFSIFDPDSGINRSLCLSRHKIVNSPRERLII